MPSGEMRRPWWNCWRASWLVRVGGEKTEGWDWRRRETRSICWRVCWTTAVGLEASYWWARRRVDERVRQTGGIVRVGVVGSVCWARPEHAPEGAAVHAGPQAGDVDVAVEAAVGEGLAECPIVYVVVVEGPDEDGQVIVSICPCD